ncbi:MAG: hypothetical protein QOF79_179 [Actinomycetota bacterium]|nr:hypothetical protein [Actinomycetota bacterium]
MVLTGSFQFYRGAVADGIVFIALAVALIADSLGWLPRFRARERKLPRLILVLALAVAAAVLALTPRHGIADGIVLAISGILVLIVAWPDQPATSSTRWTRRMARSAYLWAALGIAVCLWELTMYFLGSFQPTGRTDFPALSDLLDPLLQHPVARILFAAAWLLGGVALSRRGRTR